MFWFSLWLGYLTNTIDIHSLGSFNLKGSHFQILDFLNFFGRKTLWRRISLLWINLKTQFLLYQRMMNHNDRLNLFRNFYDIIKDYFWSLNPFYFLLIIKENLFKVFIFKSIEISRINAWIKNNVHKNRKTLFHLLFKKHRYFQ
jgi:hypothetical protein